MTSTLRTGILIVRESKFGKSRGVALHPSTAAALRNYAGLCAPGGSALTVQAFFVSTRQTRLCLSNASTVRLLAW